MIVIGAVLVAGIILELCAVVTAPLGYQDDRGFHVGVEHEDEEAGWYGANPS